MTWIEVHPEGACGPECHLGIHRLRLVNADSPTIALDLADAWRLEDLAAAGLRATSHLLTEEDRQASILALSNIRVALTKAAPTPLRLIGAKR